MTKSATGLWLDTRAPGFRELPEPDRHAIYDFALLWSLFEAQVMDGRAQADRIRDRVDQWTVDGTLNADQFGAELGYFRARYYGEDGFTYRFEHLNLRDRDHPDMVAAVISGANDEPRDRILALLMIVWRLRNNLFHGAKWAYQLREQQENFSHANAVLMRLLENHGQLA